MITASSYYYVYLLIVVVLSLFVFSKYGYYTMDRVDSTSSEPIAKSLLLCVFMALFIGFRPISGTFIDMANYAEEWETWNVDSFNFSWDVENILFDNLRMFMSTFGMSVELFFLLISCIYFFSAYLACRKLFPCDTLLAYLVFLAAFSTFSYGTNGIKAGAAASIFLLALAYHDRPVLTIVLSLVSWGFHHSMVMVVASYLFVYLFHKPKWYFALWVFCAMMAALHITAFQNMFASMADEQGVEYLLGRDTEGFRLDFILYSAMPVLVGYYAIFKKRINSKTYNIILCLYLMTNSIWMLCMYASFTNRIAYLSWLLYPVVLIYPFLKEKWGTWQFASLKWVAFAHLAFTLFMVFIYY